MAAVAVAPVESAIAGKRFTPIEQAKGCHEALHPFFARIRKSIIDNLVNTVVITVSGMPINARIEMRLKKMVEIGSP